MVLHIIALIKLMDEAEMLKGYWDDTGLEMYIAVKNNKMVAISTKHWWRVNYISTELEPNEIWNHLKEISEEVGRKLIKPDEGDYVYIHMLNKTQTKDIFDKIVSKLNCNNTNISRVWERSWEIDDAVL